MAIVCKECRRSKRAGHKLSCSKRRYQVPEVWVDSISNRVVTDVTEIFGTDSKTGWVSQDSSDGSCDSGGL